MKLRSNRLVVSIALLSLASLVGLCVRINRAEPTARGHPLSHWLGELPGASRYGHGLIWDHWTLDETEATAALREVGPAAFPRLQRDLLRRPHDWEQWVESLRQKTGWRLVLVSDSRVARERAACGIAALRTNALPLLPWLQTQLLTYESACDAVHALTGLGSAAVPAFTNALASTNDWVANCGAWGLAQLGPDASPTLPALLLLLKRPNGADRSITLWAIGEIAEPRDLVHRILTDHLLDPDPIVQQAAREQLQRILRKDPTRRGNLLELARDPTLSASVHSRLDAILTNAALRPAPRVEE